MEAGRWTVCRQQHRRIRPIRWWVRDGMGQHLSGWTNGPGGHWWRCINSCAVSGWSPWTSCMTLCRGFRSGFCPDARQCPTSNGQGRPSLSGAGIKATTLWSGQRDPQTWIPLSIYGTSSRDVFQGVRTHRRQYRPSQQPCGRSGTTSTRSLYAVWSGACLGDAESVSSPVVATPVIEVCSVHLNCFMGPLKQHGRYCVQCDHFVLGGQLGFPNV